MKRRGLVPNFHIHASVSDLYIPTIGGPILFLFFIYIFFFRFYIPTIGGPIVEIYKSLTGT
jgi:hypothetical protein